MSIGDTVDLMQFCSKGDHFLGLDLCKPFSQGQHTYASDGWIIIRVNRRADVPPGGPSLDRLRLHVDNFVLPPSPLLIEDTHTISATPAVSCSSCKGSGHSYECPNCSGSGGYECCECGQDAECKQCGGTGRVASPHHTSSLPLECIDCDGSGFSKPEKPATHMIRIGANWFDQALIDRLKVLGAITYEMQIEQSSRPMRFHFDGGVGLIMPMRPPEKIKADEEHTA